MRGHQPTFLFYGIILAVLLLFDGVELIKQLREPPMPKAYVATKFNERNGTNGVGIYTKKMNDQSKVIENEILRKMNTTIDPCHDFYNYACGSYINETDIPAGKKMINAFSDDNDVLQEQLLYVLSDEIDPNEPLSFRVAKGLYQLCMNTTRIEGHGTKPLMDNINNLINEGTMSWDRLMRINRSLGYIFGYLFEISVGVYSEYPFHRLIFVDQPTLGLSREDLVQGEDNPNVKAYLNSMINTAVFLGTNKPSTRSAFLDILRFEIDLARITLPNEKRRNATTMNNSMSLLKFQFTYPSIDWVDFFSAMTSSPIDQYDNIIVRAPRFMDQLFPLLQRTSNHTIKGYVIWRDIQFSSYFLSKKLREIVHGAQHKHENRTKECLDVTMQRLPLAVEALYARTFAKYYPTREAVGIVNEIQREFVKILQTVDWMPDFRRKAAQDKVNSMAFTIGYRDQLMDDNNDFSQGLEHKLEASYLDTILYLDQFSTTREFSMLRQPVNYTFAHLDPAGVRVRYSRFENSIQFDPHHLPTAFFSKYWTGYMNYSVIGSFIGRALTHSFDYDGRQFDNIETTSKWWCSSASNIALVEKAFCLRRQNANLKFSVYDTAAQKIADIGGIRAAYYAYQTWAMKNDAERVLPGLRQEQMFWISAAQTWCSAYRPTVTGECSSSTSPDRLRILELMGNMDEFSTDFDCLPGSRMNLAEKCKVW